MQDAEDGFIRLLRNFQTLIRRLPFNERFEHESECDVGENVQCKKVNIETARVGRVHELKYVFQRTRGG